MASGWGIHGYSITHYDSFDPVEVSILPHRVGQAVCAPLSTSSSSLTSAHFVLGTLLSLQLFAERMILR